MTGVSCYNTMNVLILDGSRNLRLCTSCCDVSVVLGGDL